MEGTLPTDEFKKQVEIIAREGNEAMVTAFGLGNLVARREYFERLECNSVRDIWESVNVGDIHPNFRGPFSPEALPNSESFACILFDEHKETTSGASLGIIKKGNEELMEEEPLSKRPRLAISSLTPIQLLLQNRLQNAKKSKHRNIRRLILLNQLQEIGTESGTKAETAAFNLRKMNSGRNVNTTVEGEDSHVSIIFSADNFDHNIEGEQKSYLADETRNTTPLSKNAPQYPPPLSPLSPLPSPKSRLFFSPNLQHQKKEGVVLKGPLDSICDIEVSGLEAFASGSFNPSPAREREVSDGHSEWRDGFKKKVQWCEGNIVERGELVPGTIREDLKDVDGELWRGLDARQSTEHSAKQYAEQSANQSAEQFQKQGDYKAYGEKGESFSVSNNSFALPNEEKPLRRRWGFNTPRLPPTVQEWGVMTRGEVGRKSGKDRGVVEALRKIVERGDGGGGRAGAGR